LRDTLLPAPNPLHRQQRRRKPTHTVATSLRRPSPTRMEAVVRLRPLSRHRLLLPLAELTALFPPLWSMPRKNRHRSSKNSAVPARLDRLEHRACLEKTEGMERTVCPGSRASRAQTQQR